MASCPSRPRRAGAPAIAMALMLGMLALTKTSNVKEIQRMFYTC